MCKVCNVASEQILRGCAKIDISHLKIYFERTEQYQLTEMDLIEVEPALFGQSLNKLNVI